MGIRLGKEKRNVEGKGKYQRGNTRTGASKKDKKYNEYVKENTPKKSWFINLCKAYLIGGLICVLGQCLTNLYMNIGLVKDTATLYTTLSLIFLSILFTD